MSVSARRFASASAVSAPRLPLRTWASMTLRLFAIQASWNYESLVGNGIGFCVEPALRLLPGGTDGEAYHRALARESQYFNAHPYLASVAVGALARAELDGEPSDRIERFRTALCGPLGSVGDRLVWAGWLPLCSLVALAAFGLGAGPFLVLALFLGLYNVGHVALRVWGLRTGWRLGLRVAPALANPVLRQGPVEIGRLAAFAAGFAFPLALSRVIGPGRVLLGSVLVSVAIGAVVIVRLQARPFSVLGRQVNVEGWRLALVVLVIFALISVAR